MQLLRWLGKGPVKVVTLYIAPGLLSPGGTPRTPKQAEYVLKHHWPEIGDPGRCKACQEAYPLGDDRQAGGGLCRPYRAALAVIAAHNGRMVCRRCRGRFRYSSKTPDQVLCPVCRDQGSLFPEIEES